jgi:hypothetical protein
MAENESLDVGNSGGQRWNPFHDAVRKGASVLLTVDFFA